MAEKKSEQDLGKGTKEAKKSLQDVAKGLDDVGSALTKGLTAPLAAVGGAALSAATTFETAFAGVRVSVDATDAELEVLRQGIRDLAAEMPQSSAELAGIADVAGRLGIGTDSILQFTRLMADLGATTDLSGHQAAEALGQLAAITGMPQDQFDQLGATVVALGNNLSATESEILAMGTEMAGVAAGFGLTEAQILGLAGAMSSLGISAGAGGTAFTQMMSGVADAVVGGGQQLDLLAQVAGMSAAEFRQAWQSDAAGALVTFIEGLGRMRAEGQSIFGVLEGLGLAQGQVRDVLLSASGAGDLFRQSLQLATQSWTENAALSEEAALRYGTVESQMAVFSGRLQEVVLTLGEALVPAVLAAMEAASPLLDVVTNLALWFANLDPSIQQLIIGFVGVLAAMGPIVSAVGAVVGAFGALLTPAGLVAAAIAAVVAIGLVLYTHWDEIAAWLTGLWERIKAMAVAVWNGIAAFFTGLWASITGALSAAWEGIRTAIATAWNAIAEWFREWFGTILLGIFTGGLGVLVLLIAGNWEQIKQWTIAAWTALTEWLAGIWETIRTLAVTAWEAIKTGILNLVTGLWEGIVAVITGLPEWLAQTWENIRQAAAGAWERLRSGVVALVDQTRQGIVEGLEAAWAYITGLPSRLWEMGRNLIRSLVEGFLSIRIPIPTFGIEWEEGPLDLRIPSLSIGVTWRDLRSFVPFLAEGGIITAPTLAVIGEAGPEAVIPLDRMDLMGGAPQVVVQWSSLARPSDHEVRTVAQLLNRELGRLMGGAPA